MQAMKAHWGVEIQTHTLRVSNKWRENGQIHFLAALPPGKSPSTHQTHCQMGPKPSLDSRGKEKLLALSAASVVLW
jgi:hypothetical protein